MNELHLLTLYFCSERLTFGNFEVPDFQYFLVKTWTETTSNCIRLSKKLTQKTLREKLGEE